jgi:hypothetical protein
MLYVATACCPAASVTVERRMLGRGRMTYTVWSVENALQPRDTVFGWTPPRIEGANSAPPWQSEVVAMWPAQLPVPRDRRIDLGAHARCGGRRTNRRAYGLHLGVASLFDGDDRHDDTLGRGASGCKR